MDFILRQNCNHRYNYALACLAFESTTEKPILKPKFVDDRNGFCAIDIILCFARGNSQMFNKIFTRIEYNQKSNKNCLKKSHSNPLTHHCKFLVL
jgi:hypothetical protein